MTSITTSATPVGVNTQTAPSGGKRKAMEMDNVAQSDDLKTQKRGKEVFKRSVLCFFIEISSFGSVIVVEDVFKFVQMST
jgi:hypothetical protein